MKNIDPVNYCESSKLVFLVLEVPDMRKVSEINLNIICFSNKSSRGVLAPI